MRRFQTLSMIAAAAVCLLVSQTAFAHPGHAGNSSLTGGFLHPIFGPDHLLAALASGLLAVRIGTRRALFLVPAAFVGLMLVGGALAAVGFRLGQAELGITLSVLVLGIAVAMTPRLPLAAAMALVGVFAICHGNAHVAEMGGRILVPYLTGLALGTLAIHVAAIVLGLWAVRLQRPMVIRFAGVLIACGVIFLVV